MRRPILASALSLLSACSASDVAPGSAFGQDRAGYVDAVARRGGPDVADGHGRPAHATDGSVAESTAAPAGADERAYEAELRRRLAAGEGVAPALELATWLADQERLAEALAVLDLAVERRPDAAALRVARAGVQRDLGRRHLAVAELRSLLQHHGGAELHPGLLFELAELEWMEGNRAAAVAVLDVLDTGHTGDPWLLQHANDRLSLRSELATAESPSRVRLRDLLGNLRGAPDPIVRLRTLEALAPVGGEVAARAIAVAVGDDEAAVRARGVQLAQLDLPALQALVRVALQDQDARVRRAAAERCRELPPAAIGALVLPALAQETDGPAFVRMHQALASVRQPAPELQAGQAEDTATRARVVAAWRERWEE